MKHESCIKHQAVWLDGYYGYMAGRLCGYVAFWNLRVPLGGGRLLLSLSHTTKIYKKKTHRNTLKEAQEKSAMLLAHAKM